MSIRSKNEKIKRKYLKWLREAEGLSEATITGVERAVGLYEEYSQDQDFASFSQKKAVGFKLWLQERSRGGATVSITTVYNQIRYVKAFFTWLAGQPGYKSRIGLDAVSYLTLERKKVREATAAKPVKFPSLEYVRQLTDSIKPSTEVARRDRALIAFLLVSGMRDQAVASLPLGCFDREALVVHQDPKRGVSTKFSKSIRTLLFNFDGKLTQYVVSWAEYLETVRLFSPADPLFPRSRVEQRDGGLTFTVTGVEPVFWKSTNSIRKILRERAIVAGLECFNPHAFRHAAVHIAMKFCTSAEQMKAVSQNLGHEHIATTVMTYGTLDSSRVQEVVGRMDFSTDPSKVNRDKTLDAAIRALTSLKGTGK